MFLLTAQLEQTKATLPCFLLTNLLSTLITKEKQFKCWYGTGY